MKIGMVCEGPTDWPAITEFFGSALRSVGLSPSFEALFPEMDRTRPEGGWGNVLLWFEKYPVSTRIQQFFGGGLFGGDLSTNPFDALIIQLDADALDDPSFKVFIKNTYEIDLASEIEPNLRADQISLILSTAAQFEQMTSVDIARHVIIPSVESTETWCVSAFNAKPTNCELLKGADLVNAFMKALEASEGRAVLVNYTNIDKSLQRRMKFCVTHCGNFDRITRDCAQFATGLKNLSALGS